jgi:hypothetical protein
VTAPTLPLDITTPGVVGDRALRALQLIRIGRHTSQVMLLPAHGLWTVSGKGPEEGSNGAGKTVLLGALSLLLGDAQWNRGGGTSASAPRLLFDHQRAHTTDAKYGSAQYGYIAGVFYHPQATEPVSVWLRITRYETPHVQVRWANGVHLAIGDGERARLTAADRCWNSLRLAKDLLISDYAATLYGSTPRCLAGIRARGSEENQDRGLLALGQGAFRPADLAVQIITLAGKQRALDSEQEQRKKMQENQAALEAQQSDYQQQYQREEAELTAITRRREAQRLSADASEAWGSYLTLRCLLERQAAHTLEDQATALDSEVEHLKSAISVKEQELRELPSREDLLRARAAAKGARDTAVAAKTKLAEEAGANRQEIATLRAQITELEPQTQLALGTTIADAAAAADAAEQARQAVQIERDAAEREAHAAQDTLDALLNGVGGPAGSALAALRAAGIDAVPLVDLITLPADARSAWEGRLSPYARAIVISRESTADASQILAAHQGTPVIVCDGPATSVAAVRPGDTGFLGDLLTRLEERMPTATADWVAGDGWVEDHDLGLAIGGGYDPPLTDRKAAVAAARANADLLRLRLDEQDRLLRSAKQAVSSAKDVLAAAQAAAEIEKLRERLSTAEVKSAGLPTLVNAAQEQEEKARANFEAADTGYTSADQSRQAMYSELDLLRHGSAAPNGRRGLTQVAQESADVRSAAVQKRGSAESLRQIAVIGDLDAAETAVAEQQVVLDPQTMQRRLADARRLLRRAVEEVLPGRSKTVTAQAAAGEPPMPGLGVPEGLVGHRSVEQLGLKLHELRDWCDGPASPQECARPFDLVEYPLQAWLDRHGFNDDSREADILRDRLEKQEKMAAAERKAEDQILILQEAQRLHLSTVAQMFTATEQTLLELLAATGRDPVALRARHNDIKDASEWLRWEVSPQWLTPGASPVGYENPPNTAELIILHLLLAVSALVSATSPRGRVLILDESGNNLDAPNLRKTATVLKQVAYKYGLTVVLACQDVYTHLVTPHSAGMIQLIRASPADVLNAAPVILQEDDDPALIHSLEPYLRMGRPTL